MINIVQPGLLTTIQDSGRWGYQAYGMPVAGAMDRYAYRLANMLVGNKPSAAVLEMTLKGGVFQFTQDVYVAICGADMQATLNGSKVANWSSFLVPAGSELSFDFAVSGCRTYLAIRGGIDVPEILGSRSTYTRAGVGGLDGRALRAGDILTAGNEVEAPVKAAVLPDTFKPTYTNHIQPRVLLGPQNDYFTDEGINTLFTARYTISSEADRMGYRLEGAKIQHKDKPDIVSDALCQGAIQVPGHGMPIIMMADRQTTGGYAKIGTVIGPDLMLLAQAKPGDSVTFLPCTPQAAVAALAAEQQTYEQIKQVLAQSALPGHGSARNLKITINSQVFHVNIEEVD